MENRQIIRETFQKYDKDNSGYLDLHEVKIALQELSDQDGDNSCYRIDPTIEEIKIIVQTVDSDSNDCLDINEFTKLIDAINETGEEVKRQFYFFDKNGDGQISKKELQKSLQELNANISKCQMKRMIREADLDGDGTISFEEFQKILISQGWEVKRF